MSSSDADRAGCRAAHDRLLADLEGLTDAEARRPSLLPGWSVGHVLTHLARNADANVWMAEGLMAGEVRVMYPDGAAGRARAIEAGAGRPAAELVGDVRRTADAVHDAWDRVTPDQWVSGAARVLAGRLPASQLPRSRWREVEIHHADLGLGFTPADWSREFVRTDVAELLIRLAVRPGLLDDDTARAILIALTGRSDAPVRIPSVMN
jgi:maleylpyruvate isomerase